MKSKKTHKPAAKPDAQSAQGSNSAAKSPPISAPESILPAYESIAACSGALGIPRTTLQAAKRAGCDAFRGPRIYTLGLIRWLFARAPDDEGGVDWKDRLTKERALREHIKRLHDEGEALPKSAVESCLASGMGALFGALDRQDSSELPTILYGLDKPRIRDALTHAHAALKAEFANALATLVAASPDTAEDSAPAPPTAFAGEPVESPSAP